MQLRTVKVEVIPLNEKLNRRESDSVQLKKFPFLHYHHLQFYPHSSPIYWVAIPNDFTLPYYQTWVYTIPSPLGDGIELRTLVFLN